MNFTAASASVVGSTSKSKWTQTLASDRLFLVIESVGDEAQADGKTFLEDIQTALKKQPLRSRADLKRLLYSNRSSDDTISFSAALIVENILYLCVKNKGGIWIQRGNKIAKVLDGNGTASGRLREGDKLFLESSGFSEAVSEAAIKNAFSAKTPTGIVEMLAPKLHEKDDVPTVSGLAVLMTQEIQKNTDSTGRTSERVSLIKILSKLHIVLPRVSLPQIRPLGLIMLLLVALLVGSILLGLSKQREQKQVAIIKETLDRVSHQYEEGMALVDLNPIRARELLTEAQTSLNQQANSSLSKDQKAVIEELLRKVNEGISFAIRKYEVQLEPFFELGLVKPQGEGSFMSLYKDALAIADTKNKSLYTLSITTKASRIVAGGEQLVSATSVAVHGEDIFMLAGEVYAVNVNSKFLRLVIPPDSQWGKASEIVAYAGNMYLLDTDNDQVWKYPQIETGFGSLHAYFLEDTLVDLNDASSMAIDGSIWIVHEGNILKFTLGEPVVWQTLGLDEELGKNLDMYLDDTTNNLYIHDISKKRVVVFDKDGDYLAQYHWGDDLQISDFVVSEVIKKILLLARGTIYSIDLK